jgi:predicted amidohydrolase YtcJ
MLDTVLENAKVITCNPAQPRAQALLIRGENIAAVGSQAEIDALKTPRTRVIDCGGKTMVPGFIDAHCHFFSGLRKLFSLDLSPTSVKSIPEMQQLIRERAKTTPAGAWISGSGYNEFYMSEKRHPTRQELDAASPDHPVMITHRSLHACVLNTLAMQKIGINNETAEPEGCIIERDLETGEPNGILFEMLSWVQKRIQTPLPKALYDWGLQELNANYLSQGITSFCEATITSGPRQFNTFSELISSHLLQSRVSLMFSADTVDDYVNSRLTPGSGDSRLRVGSLKIILSQATGQLIPTQTQLNNLLLKIVQAGFQPAIHAVEASSVEAVIKALEYVYDRLHPAGWRPRIEHCSECQPALISRCAKLGVVVVSQPGFLYYHGERYLNETPAAILPVLYPFRNWFQAGLITAGSSDAPVIPNNPLMGIYGAVTRKAASGQILQPEQCISAEQALQMYTLNAAYADCEEKEKGSLMPGKLADLLLLSDDPLACEPEAIKDIRVEMTMVGGKKVWEKE